MLVWFGLVWFGLVAPISDDNFNTKPKTYAKLPEQASVLKINLEIWFKSDGKVCNALEDLIN